MSGNASFLAGAGKSAIDIAYPVEGYVGERDRLYARAAVLAAGPSRVAIVVIDLTAVPADMVREFQETVGRTAGVAPAQVLICASHTFSAPHLSSEDEPGAVRFRRSVIDAVARAASQAGNEMRPARLGFARGMSRVNVNRDVHTAAGWWLGADDRGATDHSVAVIRIEDEAGKPIAILANYAVQSSVMNESTLSSGGILVTDDLAGAAVRHAEEQYGSGTVAMFLVGAAGDQAPYLTANRYTLDKDGNWGRSDLREAGHVLVDLLGERLGSEIVRASEEAVCTAFAGGLRVTSASVEVGTQQPPASFRDLRPVHGYDYRQGGTESVPVFALGIGDIALVGVQAELSSTTGLDIKARSQFGQTVVLTMVNGGAKYMADAASYDKITYAAMNSRYARGTAERVSSAALTLLADLFPATRPAESSASA